jgi:hypothetical protein
LLSNRKSGWIVAAALMCAVIGLAAGCAASLGSRHVPLGNIRAARAWQRRRWHRGIQRSVSTGLRDGIWQGRQRVHVGLHNVDISGSERDRQRGVIYDVPEGDDLDIGECH